MKILVLNCGSSSVKYELHDISQHQALAQGVIDRIGEDVRAARGEVAVVEPATVQVRDHGEALELVIARLLALDNGVLKELGEVAAVGHRVVHGGARFSSAVRVTPEVMSAIEECATLAPLHNPPALVGIKEAVRLLPGIPQVAVFDTAFHSTIPPRAHVYALPYSYYEEHGLRRYGFHGLSYQYVSRRLDESLGGRLRELKVVIAHLGNGASITALADGHSVDTSMGLTPLEGLMMGSRGGDLDPGLLLFLMRQQGLSVEELDDLLNHRSGLLGLSGRSNDMRDILAGVAEGDERCRLAYDAYCYRIRKYVGAYAAALGGLDVLVFTGGVGENSPEVRAAVCEGLSFLGVELDVDANREARGAEASLEMAGAKVRILVVPTDEERLIAEETAALVLG